MDITVLRKEELLLLAAELGMDINSRLRKPEIRAAIKEVGFEEDELTDAWEKICRERNERAEEKEKQEKREQRQAEIELERIKLEQTRLARSADAAPLPPAESVKMTNLLQPYKTGDDIGLYLVNFERICEKYSFHRDTWPKRLLALLPGEASQVVARLSAAEAGEYSSVKSSLLAKYRLSTEEFRRRFRQERKKSNESFVEFACSLRDNFSEWVKGTGADNFTKLGDLICLEQFYETLPDNVRLWVRDRQEEAARHLLQTDERFFEESDDDIDTSPADNNVGGHLTVATSTSPANGRRRGVPTSGNPSPPVVRQ
ncbi:hypothetical protein HPB50_001990 [Hyalomma asiaticum]|uniref:Uncharacterized protein n=1 Tax=Hyalomma asiaticum TaxID=266040 RepID=A0ACB7S3H1_HYAAI|nr:hypothetical protein HPB50_001990 [Hyalomma asiaticum]